MLKIKKKYLLDESNQAVAVQIDIKTFEKIEHVLEDYALGQLIQENDEHDDLSMNEARAWYDKLPERNDSAER